MNLKNKFYVLKLITKKLIIFTIWKIGALIIIVSLTEIT